MHSITATAPLALMTAAHLASSHLTPAAPPAPAATIALPLPGGTSIAIDANRLALTHTSPDHPPLSLAAPLPTAWPVADLATADASVSWKVPDRGLAVSISTDRHGLRAEFTATREQTLAWPESGADPRVTDLLLPNGGGICVPVEDKFWLPRLAGGEIEAAGGLTMPFWGFLTGERSVTYIMPADARAALRPTATAGRLRVTAAHRFLARDGFPPFQVLIRIGDRNPIAPALAFRRYLQDTGQFKTLREKIRSNPRIERLLGAQHAYIWGDGRTRAALDKLKDLGIDRMWLGYDQDARSDRIVVTAAVVKHARSLGYTIGPYHTFDNIQHPAKADTAESVFDLALFETGGITKADGKPRAGFWGRGHQLCSEALRRSPRNFVKERADRDAADGVDSVFVDCDAFGDLLDDFDPRHPLTALGDRRNRLDRLNYFGAGRGFVVGSETGVWWATPALAFAHGAHTVSDGALWALLAKSNRESFGGYWPPERPNLFFRPARVPPGAARALYDPATRVPLYQAVFHDALVTTDRWEFSPIKLQGHEAQRTLLELLYLMPSIWNLDRKAIKALGPELQAHHSFFGPLHADAGAEPLSRFTWLDPGRLVQQAQYGNVLELTANFGATPFEGLLPGTIRARRLDNGATTLYRPWAGRVRLPLVKPR